MLLVLTAAAGLLRSAQAGPLDQAQVDQKATWLVHIDVEAALRSVLGKYLVSKSSPNFDAGITAFKSRFGIDPRTDLRGITIYGSGADEDTAGVIAGNENIGAFFEMLPRAGMTEYRLDEESKVHSWIADGKRCYAAVRSHAGSQSRLAVFSSSEPRLLKSLAVMDGREPALASAEPSAMTEKPREGTILFAVAKDMDQSVSKKARSTVFQRTKSLRVEMGERRAADGEGGHEMYVEGVLTSASPESAMQLKNLTLGALAMAQMSLAAVPETTPAAQLMNGVSMETSGSQLVIKCRKSTEKIIEALKNITANLEVDDKGIRTGVGIESRKPAEEKASPAKPTTDEKPKEKTDEKTPKKGG